MHVQGQFMDVHIFLNGIMHKDYGLTDHGQSPWSVKTCQNFKGLSMDCSYGQYPKLVRLKWVCFGVEVVFKRLSEQGYRV